MTGAIISQFYWKDEHGQYSRYFVNGSFFFIEPDVAVTAYVNLAEARSREGYVFAEDYCFFNSDIQHFETPLKGKEGVQCIRLEREWLVEYPERNITEIHFPQPMSMEFFKVSAEKAEQGQQIMCEGYGFLDFVKMGDDPDTIDFMWLSKREASRIKLFRQGGYIDKLVKNDSINVEHLTIDKIDVLYTSCFPNISMIGGPVLNSYGTEVIGVLSHELSYEEDEPNPEDEGLRAVRIRN